MTLTAKQVYDKRANGLATFILVVVTLLLSRQFNRAF